MATLPSLVLVPCESGVLQTPVDVPNSALVFRAPIPQPLLSSSGGSTIPLGPQRWPL